MRIAIDAMGGDKAPGAIIEGALEAVKLLDSDDQIALVGAEDIIKDQLRTLGANADNLRIIHAPDIIEMDEAPIEAIRRKRKSSIAVMAKMASEGQTDAVISAGNTGAAVAACQMRMRNLPGVNRPGIAVVFPTFEGPVVMCDAGANIACKPINLYQYAVMASEYSEQVLGIANPRIGIMSVGEEEAKGTELIQKARALLRSDPNLNFRGNIEGRDIFNGVCDVAVCEGFVGNVVLKLTEGLVNGLFQAIGHELVQEDRDLATKFKPVVSRIYKKYDYNEYGGAPLLGVNGTAIICHGASEARTIKNAVATAKKFHTNKINDAITAHISTTSTRSTDV